MVGKPPRDARKALMQSNGSLRADLLKWRDAPWQEQDVVIGCQILAHDAPREGSTPLPPEWTTALAAATEGFTPTMPALSVCYPCVSPETEGIIDRYVSIFFFNVR